MLLFRDQIIELIFRVQFRVIWRLVTFVTCIQIRRCVIHSRRVAIAEILVVIMSMECLAAKLMQIVLMIM